jgi:hypothetical protein
MLGSLAGFTVYYVENTEIFSSVVNETARNYASFILIPQDIQDVTE